jgi:hypothetical protein
MGELAKKHGFKIAGFRAFEKAVTEETIAQVRAKARARRSKSTPVASSGLEAVAT